MGANVQALYEKLKSDPAVDTQQVYLFAAGDEVPYLCQLVETDPAPWRGLIETGSGQLPDFSDAPRFQLRPKILICFGELLRMGDQLDEYQQDMLSQGAVGRICHVARGNDAVCGRGRKTRAHRGDGTFHL